MIRINKITKPVFLVIAIVFLINKVAYAQETLPVYTDYLTDNIYLIHPTGAGISEYGKLRITGRKQWLDYDNAPELQTLSFHTHLGNNTAIGAVFYNDKNGHFSQTGGQLTYAYHISFKEDNTHQLSFGLSMLLINNKLDGRDFIIQDTDVDPQKYTGNYYNADASVAYRNKGFFSFYTVKNVFLTKRNLFDNEIESNNLRRHLVTVGYQFNEEEEESIKFQPSIMTQFIEETQELYLDTNIKVFVPFKNSELWGGVSYRRSFGDNNIEQSSHITPFLGIKYRNFVASYSYTKQQNEEIFMTGGFHQITLGYNFRFNRYSKKATWDL